MSVSIPSDARELDAAWFARALERGDIARVEAAPTPEQGRASRTYRARIDFASGQPLSLIVKISLADSGYLTRRLGLGTYRLEVDFYRVIAPRLGDLVPHCLLAQADDATGHFVLVMEDLAPARAAGEDIEADLLQAVEGFARIHARCWGDDRVAEVVSRCVLPGMLDQRKVGAVERQIAGDLLARKLQTLGLPEVIVAAVEAELANHDRFAEHLRTRQLTCCHGDAHLPQIMLPSPEGGRLAIFDWQTPHFGSGAMDLRALLITSELPLAERRALQPKLLGRYHRTLTNEGVTGYRREELEDDHRLMLHHNLMWALSMPHKETPESLNLWRTRFVEPLLGPLEDDDYVGFVECL